MVRDILAFLLLFHGRLPDPESHEWLSRLATDKSRWPQAHDVFDRVRKRRIEAEKKKERTRECQYYFEEMCLKALYNLTDTGAPFDEDSPYWIAKSAFTLARAVGVPDAQIVAILAANERIA